MNIASYKKLCRICLTKSLHMVAFETELIPFGETSKKLTVKEALEYVMSAKLIYDGRFPEVICPMCSSLLKVAHDLKNQFTKSQNILAAKFERYIYQKEDSDVELTEEDCRRDHSYCHDNKETDVIPVKKQVTFADKSGYKKGRKQHRLSYLDKIRKLRSMNSETNSSKWQTSVEKNEQSRHDCESNNEARSQSIIEDLTESDNAEKILHELSGDKKNQSQFFETERKQNDSSVELIYNNNHFNLKDIIIVGEPTVEKPDFKGFLQNLGKSISVRFANTPDTISYMGHEITIHQNKSKQSTDPRYLDPSLGGYQSQKLHNAQHDFVSKRDGQQFQNEISRQPVAFDDDFTLDRAEKRSRNEDYKYSVEFYDDFQDEKISPEEFQTADLEDQTDGVNWLEVESEEAARQRNPLDLKHQTDGDNMLEVDQLVESEEATGRRDPLLDLEDHTDGDNVFEMELEEVAGQTDPLDSNENDSIDTDILKHHQLKDNGTHESIGNENLRENSVKILNAMNIHHFIDENEYHIMEFNAGYDISIPLIKILNKPYSKILKTAPIDTEFLQTIKDTLSSYLLLMANDIQSAENVEIEKSVQYNYQQQIENKQTKAIVFKSQEAPRKKAVLHGRYSLYYKCQLCKAKCASKPRYIAHLKRTHITENKLLYMCEKCLVVSPSIIGANVHILQHLNIMITKRADLKYKCVKCGQIFAALNQLECHRKTNQACYNEEEKSEFVFEQEKGKEEEMRQENTVQRESDFHSETDKENMNRNDKKIGNTHEQNEKSIRKRRGKQNENYVCHICGHVSVNKKRAKYHLEGHNDNRFICNICGKQYPRAYSLTKHLLIHSGVRNQLCPLCGKTFFHVSSLNCHLRIHNNERKYPCPHCDRKFFMMSNLQRHLRFHEKFKPYECSFCQKSFYSKGERSVHEKRHTGHRPYYCKYCDKGFTRAGNFKLHILNHDGPYSCDLCSETFIEDKYILWHKKDKHNINTHNGVQLLSRLESENCFPAIVNS